MFSVSHALKKHLYTSPYQVTSIDLIWTDNSKTLQRPPSVPQRRPL